MLHIHEKFSTSGPESYSGLVIAEYELPNGNSIEVLADAISGVFWLNEFQEDGVMLEQEMDRPKTYDEAIIALIRAGQEKRYILEKKMK